MVAQASGLRGTAPPLYAGLPRRPCRMRVACHSNFSFLDGASHAESWSKRQCVWASTRWHHRSQRLLGGRALRGAARAHGLPTVFGAELTLGLTGKHIAGQPDPAGEHLLVLDRNPTGYARLGCAISRAQMAGEKGAPRIALPELADIGAGGDGWVVLTSCRKGTVPAALERDGPRAARRALDDLVARSGAATSWSVVGSTGIRRLGPQRRRSPSSRSMPVSRSSPPTTCTTTVRHGASWRLRWPLSRSPFARRDRGWLPPPAPRICDRARSSARSRAIPVWSNVAAELGRACMFDLGVGGSQTAAVPCPRVTTRCRGCVKSRAGSAAAVWPSRQRARAGCVPSDRP